MDTARLVDLALAHLRLSLWALMLGSALSIPLGIAAARRPWLERAGLAVASVIQTVPGLALLAVMVPALAAVAAAGVPVRSVGVLPAVLGLMLYSLLPILRNTVVGIAGVDPAVLEAARGVGMTDRQRLWLVELPLALPVIIAGLRTATVWTVGMATLATPVGASSLGDLIFAGLQTRDHAAVISGCLASAGLALALDGLVRAAERGLRQRQRIAWLVPTSVVAVACLYTVGFSIASGLGDDRGAIRVGAKPFTEQYILAEVLSERVEAAGGSPQVLGSLGSNVAFEALVAGDLDLYVEYTGTIWTAYMGREDVPEDPGSLRREVEAYLEAEHGVVIAATLGFENAYALATRAPGAGGPRVTTISGLARVSAELAIAGDYEFFDRGEWRSLQGRYALSFADRRTMDPALLYTALDQREVDVIAAYTTDGRLASDDYVVLDDDRGAIPPYDAVVLARRPFLAARPRLAHALAALEAAIDARTMRRLNRAVDLEGRTPQQAAAEAPRAPPGR
ncbi:MAG: ABC transporter permease/substrate-binding protein [Sandaracinaceae bacterium]